MSRVRKSSPPTSDGLPAGAEPHPAIARARWLEVQDALLRGVAHALSNRIATVSAAVYMLEHRDVTPEQAATSLRDATERMDELLQLLRLLPSRDDTSFEPVMPRDVVEQAVTLHGHHGDLREVPVTVRYEGDVLPVWVEPHAFLQALLLALTAAARSAGTEVVLLVRGDEDRIGFAVYPAGDASADAARTAEAAAAAGQCLRSAQGTAAPRADGGCDLSLPTLTSVRRAGR